MNQSSMSAIKKIYTMKSIDELNIELKNKLSKKLNQTLHQLKEINSNYPEVMEVKRKLLDFNIVEFKESVKESLRANLITKWEEYQLKEQVDVVYDMIYFEFHENSFEHSQAQSYGIYDIKNFELRIDNYDLGYEYQYGEWYAGEGINLKPFETTKQLSYQNINNQQYFDLISWKDNDSGNLQIWNYIFAICDFVFNEAFMNADEQDLFDQIKIRKGGFFGYNIHDDGLGSPFYLKK